MSSYRISILKQFIAYLVILCSCATIKTVATQKQGLSSRVTSIISLNKKDNGVDGALVLAVDQLRIENHDKVVLEKYQVPGRDPELSSIQGNWMGGPIFLVTDDESIEFGSYNGISTRAFQVKNSKFEWAPVHLMNSLKTHWKAELPPDKSQVTFLKVSCRPDFEKTEKLSKNYAGDLPFVISYIRYQFDGLNWNTFEKKVDGFWEYESDEDFPSRRQFP